MTQSISIQLKAGFLLFIFSSNIVVGFACSIGIDMGFNTHHHQQEEPTEIRDHDGANKHHHGDAGYEHSRHGGKDDCCNDKVLQISKANKAVPQTIQLSNKKIFTAFTPVNYNFAKLYCSPVHTLDKCFYYGHHPPMPDIRIAIRSFQI